MKFNRCSNKVVLLGLLIICQISFFHCLECVANDNTSTPADNEDAQKKPSEVKPRILETFPFKNEKGQGYSLYSTGMTFNLLGDHSLVPLEIKKVITFDLAEGKKACVALDDFSDSSIVIIYADVPEESRSFSLNEDAHGWLLCHYGIDDEQMLNYIWRGFLLEPTTSSVVYSLTGNITLLKDRGIVRSIIFKELVTRKPVRPNIKKLMDRGDSLEREIAELTNQLSKNPNSELITFRIEQAQSGLYGINECLEEENMKPASVDGRVDIKLRAREPNYDFSPLL